MKNIVLSALLASVYATSIASQVSSGDQYFDSKGVKIRYVSAGEGEAVVLIHGWMSDATMWGRDRSGEARLDASGSPGFRLLALDCRGHGKSGKPHDPKFYDEEVANDVIRLLDHLKIKRAHLVGYSSGAFVVGSVAARYPHRVMSAVFAGQAPVIGDPNPNDFTEVETFAQIVEQGRDLGEYYMATWPKNRPKPTSAQASALAKVFFRDKDVTAFALAGRGFPKLAISQSEMRRFRGPILFLYGENESPYMLKRIPSVRAIIGRGETISIAGGDHVTTLAKPEFGRSLVSFLRHYQEPQAENHPFWPWIRP